MKCAAIHCWFNIHHTTLSHGLFLINKDAHTRIPILSYPHTIKRTHGSEWSIHMHRIHRTHSPLSCDLQKQIDFKKVFVFFFCSVVGFERFEFIAAFGFVEIWIWSKFFDVHTQHSRYEISERCVYCFACKYTLAWASVCLSFWLCI